MKRNSQTELGVSSTSRFDGRSEHAHTGVRTGFSPTPCAEVLLREQFMSQLKLEKRRTDRSHEPLSLVVMRLPADGSFDSDDLRDIIRDLGGRKRATDFIGYLGEGTIAFLLPYLEAKAADTFAKMIADRVGARTAVVSHATYPDRQFDEFVRQSLPAAADCAETTLDYSGETVTHSRWALAVKRGMDVIGGVALLAIGSPLMVATAIAVKLSSPGPIIFRQQRIGRGGVPFEFYKFRSMGAGADDRVHREYVSKLIAGRHDEINEGDSQRPIYKLQSDPRITPVGRIIRKTSIDELPQLLNVLKGDMSLVGPRPPIAYETEKYQSWHMRRLQAVRPGMTGLWQVEGRSKTSFDAMVRLDLLYIRNWSLWLDIKILAKTLLVVVRRDGAD
jgi:lipopolysaccharide/colanic/teichoic acid biosynthesis glycosyltransferase